jgi:Holliday junction resolvase RusA-like endonuclease
MSDYTFTLPIYGVVAPTKNNKNCALTFNWAMAANRWTYSKAKKKFSAMMQEQLNSSDKIDGVITITYKYYAKRRGTDLDNFSIIARKFFQDCLSKSALIEDDNCSVIVKNSELYMGIDKDNPRIEAEITIIS